MPDWKSIVRQRLAPLGMTAAAESDLVEEIAQHLEDGYRELQSGGCDAGEAYRQTMAELDDMYPLRASIAGRDRMPARDDFARGGLLDGVGKDLRFALRSMRKNPVFVLFVVMTLALGIGANTTVFTLINTLILHPLTVEKVDELVAVTGAGARESSKSATVVPVSFADLRDYRERNQVFTSMAAYTSPRPATWQGRDGSQSIFSELVTANYFATLGVAPVRGRFFTADEDDTANPRAVAVMNYGAWQQRFGGAEDIVGRELRVNNVVLTVIGVAPQHFLGINAIFGPDLWVPAGMAERLFPNMMQNAMTDRGKAAFVAVGRLRPGVSEAQARANVETLSAALAHDSGEDRAATVRPLRDVLLSVNGTTSSGMMFGSAALLVVVGIVLLIACSNVANLMLARSAARQQEMAVRVAMGASRSRLMRQLLTESMLLGLISGLLGVLLAFFGLDFLFGRLPGWANFPSPKLDATVFLFALGVSLATGLLFGIIPAWKASRADVAERLKEAGRGAGRSRSRVNLTKALLVGQVAFSFLLLVTAALFLRSIGRAYEVDPGFQTAHLAVFPSNPGQAGYGKAKVTQFYQEVRERVLRLPGVAEAAWASNMPLWAPSVSGFAIEGRQERGRADQVRGVVNIVDRDYFGAAGVRMVSGRKFTDADRDSSLPVAIVNEKMAQDYWPGGALGRRIQLPGEKVMRQVVGVARTANYTGWGEAPQACVYVPLAQKDSEAMVLYVRSKGDPRELLAPVEREVRAAGPEVLLFGTRTGSEVIDGGLFQARMGVGLLSTFGMLALGLASIGLYGVLAYSVNQRKREIGLRMALGATRGSVLVLVLGEGMRLVTVGIAIGLAAALIVGRLLSRMLFGVGASDPVSVGGAAIMLAGVALLACYLPARWATRVDPMEALHEG